MPRHYRVHPRLRCTLPEPGRAELSLPFGCRKLRLAEKVAHTLQELKERAQVTEEEIIQLWGMPVLHALVKYHFLLPPQACAAVEGGLCTATPKPVGRPLAVCDLDQLQARDTVLLHAPIQTTRCGEISVAGGGQRVRAQLGLGICAPPGAECDAVLLDLDFGSQLHSTNLHLFDLGDVVFQPEVDSAANVGERLHYLCSQIVPTGARLLLLGGDHAQARYSIAALSAAYPHIGVLQFDAHPDLYAVGNESDGVLNHANVMHWVRRMPHVQTIWQVGLRDFFLQPTTGLRLQDDPKLNALSAFEAQTQGYGRMFRHMDRKLAWFISFDVDVLAGSELPHTATPVLGGLDLYGLLACFETLFSDFHIVGMEFVEVGDAPQGAQGAAAIAARLASRFLFHLNHATPSTGLAYVPAA